MILPDTSAVSWSPIGDQGFTVLLPFLAAVTGCAVGFVVASVVLRAHNNRIARYWAILEARWDPLMLDLLAGDGHADAMVRAIPPGDERRFVEYLMRYARRIRGPERLLLAGLARPYLYTVSGELRHRSVERRARAVQTLGELGLERYRAELLAALDDPAPLVVIIAAVALSREYHADDVLRVVGSVSRLELLTNRLLVSMLQRMGPQSAWAFHRTLADPAQPLKLRTVAAKVLAQFNDQAAGDIAARVIGTTGDTDLRVALLQVLERIGAAEHLDVARRLVGDPVAAVRGAAVRILGSVGGAAEAPLLLQALDDPVSWVAIHAAEALRRAGRTDLLEQAAEARQRRASVVSREMLFQADG